MLLAAALLALALAAGEEPAPPPPTDVRAEVSALLGVIDRPVTPEAFRAFGPEGEAALAEIARSPAAPPFRARALEVLAALRSPGALEVHRELASPGAPRSVRRAAVRGLGRLLPPSGIGRRLRPILEGDEDPAIRAEAAETLAAHAPRASCAAVRAQARREPPSARARFRRAIAACERAP